MPDDILLRSATDQDLTFLAEVYAATRAAELAQTGWNEAQCAAFLAQQFDAQHRYYHEHFTQASYGIVLYRGEPIGRLYVDRRSDEIRIIDIALLPAYRGKGLGTQLLRSLIDEAQRGGVALRIHVEQFNPALNLYRRLGFVHVEDQGVYFLMERPATPPAASGKANEKPGEVTT